MTPRRHCRGSPRPRLSAGESTSVDFPTTAGAFDTMFNGVRDAFLTVLSRAGTTLRYLTYIGGSLDDAGRDVAVDRAGDAYVTGATNAPDFPVTPRAFRTFNSGATDGFIMKIRPRRADDKDRDHDEF